VNYGNISAHFRVMSKHFEAALTYLSASYEAISTSATILLFS